MAGIMRVLLTFVTVIVCSSTLAVADAPAQPDTTVETLSGTDPQGLLLGPRPPPPRSDDLRSLSAPPSAAPDANHVIERSREISPAERQQLLQNQTRQAPADWTIRERR
jgi:hypothetical protein